MVNALEGLNQVILRKVRRFRSFVSQKRSLFAPKKPGFLAKNIGENVCQVKFPLNSQEIILVEPVLR